ncbi:hypothetical protein ZOSMA_56G01390 [Zostera marina]|uniref:Uncharacterized protein n=1 Tax=Zostera marina TaxID=29655 RepID=A0A0K9NXY6_ZOSMR|nr:hypothetical protein ZOSMA_56G01390 [Zostera marina]
MRPFPPPKPALPKMQCNYLSVSDNIIRDQDWLACQPSSKFISRLKMLSSSSSDDQRSSDIHAFKKRSKFINTFKSLNTSTDVHSFRIYYAVAPASIPFTWESQPGTPKRDKLPELRRINPPLTPPPSYQFHSKNTTNDNTVGFKNKNKTKKLSSVLFKKSTSLFATMLKKNPHPLSTEERKKVGSPKSSLCFRMIRSDTTGRR